MGDRLDCLVAMVKRTRNDLLFVLNRYLAFFLYILIIKYIGERSDYLVVPL